MRTDAVYTPSDCFGTFPFPTDTRSLESIGEKYDEHRRHIMSERKEGLTATYNRFHDPTEPDATIQKLRNLHVEMDRAVLAAYGWSDLDPGHGFHATDAGVRFTLSEPARREVLDRLLALNHERYAEEAARGLHAESKAGRKRDGEQAKRKPIPELLPLFEQQSSSRKSKPK